MTVYSVLLFEDDILVSPNVSLHNGCKLPHRFLEVKTRDRVTEHLAGLGSHSVTTGSEKQTRILGQRWVKCLEYCLEYSRHSVNATYCHFHLSKFDSILSQQDGAGL